MAGTLCPDALPDGAGGGAFGGGLTTPPLGGARLIAGGGETEGIEAGGMGGPKIELPHCAEADCGIQSAQMKMAACKIRQEGVESPEFVIPAISTAIAAI